MSVDSNLIQFAQKGQAHFPCNKEIRCCNCLHWGEGRFPYGRDTKTGGKKLRDQPCKKYQSMPKSKSFTGFETITHDAMACKYFEQRPGDIPPATKRF